ncbi:circadian clock protein KaiA [Nostoc sp. MBR 210]|nr:circadian clock protein KaiA [Nostoc sp. MBR 210]
MTQVDQQVLLQQIKSDYRQILIDYFTTDKTLKEKIDKFINTVFCANIPVPQIIEIHMELIDEFSKQLKLEGRSDETLLDYRLTLIDILAHLCEAYRCAISK